MIEVLTQTSPSAVPVARLWLALLGMALGAIVLMVGLLVLNSIRRSRRSKTPGKTMYVDAWAEAGRRAKPEPSAGQILGDARDGDDGADDD